LRGDDLAQRRLAVAIVGRRVEREAQRRLLGDLEARELQIEAAERGVREALQTLPAPAHILPRPDRREVGTAREQVADEVQASSPAARACDRAPGCAAGDEAWTATC